MSYKLSNISYSSHQKIVKYIESGTTVLDVGCARGYLGKECKNKGCYVAGIEVDKEDASEAGCYIDRVICGDVEKIYRNLDFDKLFDYIIFADILEHLKYPEIILDKFKKFLKPRKGKIIVSLPNVARIDIRLKLLFGMFEYQDGGILDKTHLRFFTLKSARTLISKTGYEIKKEKYAGVFNNIVLINKFPSLFAVQFIFIGVPK